jgi:LysM repeat protein
VPLLLNDPTHCGYVHPFNGPTTSGFGFRSYRYHFGVDINLETGDPVSCAFDGKVRIAQKSKTYGNVVVVRHNNGLETYYAHLSKLIVQPGQDVVAGQELGLGGNTGHSHGSHLHFEVRYKGQPIDPTSLIDFQNKKLKADVYNLTQEDFEYLMKTYKVVYRTRKGKKVVKYYTPSGAHGTMNTRASASEEEGDNEVVTIDSKGKPVTATDKTTTAASKTTSKENKVSDSATKTSTVKAAATKTTSAVKNTAAAAKTGTATKTTTGTAQYYSIKKGDTLGAVAVKYHTTVAALCKLNGLKSTSTLQINQKVRVK